MTINGFVFDFDGLILDTELPRFTAWQETFDQYGFSLTYRDWWKTIGTGPTAYDPGTHLFELTHGKIDIAEVREATDQRTNKILESVMLLPGVASFIQQAHEQNVHMAVASSSQRDWVVPHLERFNLLQYFEAVFTSENVTEVKPHPALYQLALQKLSLKANAAVAFEDSPNGIKAAKGAGIYCVAVPNHITREMDLGLADCVADSFEKISLTELISLNFQ